MAAETVAGRVSLSFSPGAMSEPVVVSLRPALSPPAPDGLALVGGSFALEARTAAGAPVAIFNQPFTLTIEYDEADLAGGMDEASLALTIWDESVGEWVAVASELDVEADSLVASLDRVATFAVLGRIESGSESYLPIILKGD